MKLHVLCFKNIMIATFTTPQFVDIAPEDAATQLSRSLVLQFKKDPQKVLEYESLTLHHIAEFDDQTGIITPLPEPVLLLNCFDVVNQIKLQVASQNDKKESVVDEQGN